MSPPSVNKLNFGKDPLNDGREGAPGKEGADGNDGALNPSPALLTASFADSTGDWKTCSPQVC